MSDAEADSTGEARTTATIGSMASMASSPAASASASASASAPASDDDRGSTPRLRLASASLSLGGRPVVDAVSASLHGGAWVAIVGPNGAGKSSMLSLLAGLRRPDAGQVWLDERVLSEWSIAERARRVAWLAQQGEAEGDIAARDVVALGRLPHHGLFGAPGREDREAVEAAMVETECAAFATRRLGELSGGERQRVLLARALAVRSPILLLDEPTAHLDAPHQSALVRSVARRAAAGAAVAVVLHDLTLALTADRVWLMEEGRLLLDAASDDPALHRALVEVFDGAIAIGRLDCDDGVRHLVRPLI